MIDDRHSIAELQRILRADVPDDECSRCRNLMTTDDGLEPSAMCHACAQWFAAQIGPLVLEIAAALAWLESGGKGLGTNAEFALADALRKVRP